MNTVLLVYLTCHPIPVPIPCMYPAPHLRQQAAERRTRAVTQRRGVLPPQRGVDVRRGHQPRAFLARLGKAETGAD